MVYICMNSIFFKFMVWVFFLFVCVVGIRVVLSFDYFLMIKKVGDYKKNNLVLKVVDYMVFMFSSVCVDKIVFYKGCRVKLGYFIFLGCFLIWIIKDGFFIDCLVRMFCGFLSKEIFDSGLCYVFFWLLYCWGFCSFIYSI